jgi:phosphatidylglycerol:prolipoprotein diacylglycerol transferase
MYCFCNPVSSAISLLSVQTEYTEILPVCQSRQCDQSQYKKRRGAASFSRSWREGGDFDFPSDRSPSGYNPTIVLSPHLASSFPFYLHLGPYSIHPHLFFETLAYVAAFRVYLTLRRRFGDPIPTPLRWAVIAAAVAGAALGSKLLYLLEDPQLTLHNLHNPGYLIGGKTIVGGLAGGLISVELIKRYIGFHQSTGDLYAIPLALGIAIGRVGCFLTGLSDNTYGTPTRLPWAVNFGDGIPRHPTQLYEIIFLLALIPFLYFVLKRIVSSKSIVILSGAPPSRSEGDAESKDPVPAVATTAPSGSPLLFLPGDAFKFFMVSYLSFRFLADFIKPYPRLFLGLGGIQWACVLLLLYYSRDIARCLRHGFSRAREEI